MLEKVAHGEDGPGAEPATHVVARDMIEHGIARDLEDIVLQLLQGMDAHNLLMGLRVAEDEVAEAHVLLHEMAQVNAEHLRVLVYELKALSLGSFAVGRLGALHDERHVLVLPAYGLQEFEAGLRIFVLFVSAHGTLMLGVGMDGEAHVADDAQAVVLVFLIELNSLVIGTGQQHLWTAAHAQRGGMAVEGLGGEVLTLLQDIVVEVGQDAGIEADGVLDKENHLHAGRLDVVVDVHLVLNELDDGEDEVGVAEPAKDIVEDAQVLVLHALADAVGERSEHHAVDVGELLLDASRHGESVVVGISGHADDEVDLRRAENLLRLLDGRHLGERGWIAQSKLRILVIDLFLHAPVVLKHEGIVGIGHDEHIIDMAHHQVDKRHVLEDEPRPFLGYLGRHKLSVFSNTANLHIFPENKKHYRSFSLSMDKIGCSQG